MYYNIILSRLPIFLLVRQYEKFLSDLIGRLWIKSLVSVWFTSWRLLLKNSFSHGSVLSSNLTNSFLWVTFLSSVFFVKVSKELKIHVLSFSIFSFFFSKFSINILHLSLKSFSRKTVCKMDFTQLVNNQ